MKWLPFGVLLLTLSASARNAKTYTVVSSGAANFITMEAGGKFRGPVSNRYQLVVAPSPISMQLTTGEAPGKNKSVTSSKSDKTATTFNAVSYIKNEVEDNYNQLTLVYKGNYGLVFLAYNDGVAYRFFTKRTGSIKIKSEEATFYFDNDYRVLLPDVRDLRSNIFDTLKTTAAFKDDETPMELNDCIALLLISFEGILTDDLQEE